MEAGAEVCSSEFLYRETNWSTMGVARNKPSPSVSSDPGNSHPGGVSLHEMLYNGNGFTN